MDKLAEAGLFISTAANLRWTVTAFLLSCCAIFWYRVYWTWKEYSAVRGGDHMYENKAALGYQNFEEVRTQHIFYIDKTDFIREWWECADKVTLITRPRRFGKTLNMSMTECFFSNKYAGRSDLFEGLSIWEKQAPDGDYPYR